MIICNLTKPESTLDQVKKSYPKLQQTDAAQVATALVLSGRYALASYDEKTYTWPEDYESLAKAMIGQLESVQQQAEPVKKTKAALAAAEEEVLEIKIGLVSNFEQGERVLGDRGDLKTLFSDILHQGVEFQYGPTDIGWQWALDRANWNTLSDGILTRRIKLKAVFQGDSTGVEMGQTGPKKTRAKKAAAAVEVPAEAPAEEAVVEEVAE